MDDLSDADLVHELSRGSQSAGAALFARHYRQVWRTAFAVSGRRVLADEAAQDAFLRLIDRGDRYDPRRPLRPWLHAVAAHRAIDLLRRERRQTPFEQAPETAVEWDPPEEGATSFLDRLAALSPERRAVVVLRYGLDIAPDDIARLLDVPVGTVHSRLARALAQLREEADTHAE
jgi:RNA polymerase sigma-70 factor (ECF subfamily)